MARDEWVEWTRLAPWRIAKGQSSAMIDYVSDYVLFSVERVQTALPTYLSKDVVS